MGTISIFANLAGISDDKQRLCFAVAFAFVLLLIAELDRGQEGMLRVGQQAMIDLQKSMEPSPSPTGP